jgi:hypothetical protein
MAANDVDSGELLFVLRPIYSSSVVCLAGPQPGSDHLSATIAKDAGCNVLEKVDGV